ncbi:MAG: DUF6516 family protein [Desulfobacterales bacterium]|nr:DUF6516 family protein [Desulfobacterales bacterium]
MDPETYLIEIEVKLSVSSFIRSIEIIDERAVLSDRGYFRAQLTLVNGDFLELSEYFVLEEGRYVPKRYRYQWMDGVKRHLKKRWDNAEHFPSLSGFPDHVHIGGEENVVPSNPIRIIHIIEQELSR